MPTVVHSEVNVIVTFFVLFYYFSKINIIFATKKRSISTILKVIFGSQNWHILNLQMATEIYLKVTCKMCAFIPSINILSTSFCQALFQVLQVPFFEVFSTF